MSKSLTTDEQVLSALATITRIQNLVYKVETVDQGLEYLAQHCVLFEEMPFSIADLPFFYEQMAVVSVLLFGRRDPAFNRVLPEQPPGQYLVWDKHLKGREALFILEKFEMDDSYSAFQTLRTWSNSSPHGKYIPCFTGTDLKGTAYAAVQLCKFFQ
jgi:hypothetical protein